MEVAMTLGFLLTDRTAIGLVWTIFLHWCIASPHQIHIERFHKIETGMTEMQVQKLLGVKAGNHSYRGLPEYFGDAKIDPKTQREWVGDQIAIVIFLDKNGKVRGRGIGLTEYPPWSLGAFRREIRLRLGLERRITF
jgi:hypothetical protein